MATEVPGYSVSVPAGADLSTSQYKFVKLNTSGQAIAIAAITDTPLGILQNKPLSGEMATVLVYGISKAQADVALTAADPVATSIDGQASNTGASARRVGQVIKGAAAAGNLATVLIDCANLSAVA